MLLGIKNTNFAALQDLLTFTFYIYTNTFGSDNCKVKLISYTTAARLSKIDSLSQHFMVHVALFF